MINETRNAFMCVTCLSTKPDWAGNLLFARSQYNLIFTFTAKPLFLTCYMCTSYSQSTTWNRNTSMALMCEQHWFCCYCLAHTCGGYFSLLHVQSSGWFGAGFQTKDKMHKLQGNSVRGCRHSATMWAVSSKSWWWFEIPVFTEGIIIYTLGLQIRVQVFFLFHWINTREHP